MLQAVQMVGTVGVNLPKVINKTQGYSINDARNFTHKLKMKICYKRVAFHVFIVQMWKGQELIFCIALKVDSRYFSEVN